MRASARAVGLPEALEQLGQERRGDALAAIRDRQLDVRARARQSELDPAPRGCELDGVAEQVPDHLLQAERIAEHQAGARIHQQLEHELLGVGRGADGVHGRLDHVRQLDGPLVDVELPGDDS